jgi:hypothetical protein
MQGIGAPSQMSGPPPGKRQRVYSRSGYTIERYANYKRFWALYDPEEELVCLAVYKRGAEEVVRRLHAASCAFPHPALPRGG